MEEDVRFRSVLELPEPSGVLSAAGVKDVAADVIGQLPLRGIEGRTLDFGDIWPVVTMVSVNQSHVWEITFQTFCDWIRHELEAE